MKNDEEFHAKFTLRQHTPMIHFQADEPGALLRVSELKPAFDRYLREYVFENNFESCKQYLVGYTKDREADLRGKFAMEGAKAEGECSFDYKVKILASEKATWKEPVSRQAIKPDQNSSGYAWKRNSHTNKVDIEQFPCFFGELGEGKLAKHLVLSKEPITANFFSLYPELIAKIKDHFPAFLSRKNFGTRQSKGFGCFSVTNWLDKSTDLYVFKLDLQQEVNQWKTRWVKEYTFRNGAAPENEELMVEVERFRLLFRHIELFWRVVRSGYNLPNKLYVKAPLFFYLRNQNKQWDKRSIKEHHFNDALLRHQKAHPRSDILMAYDKLSSGGNPLLYRDLLGLATDITWGNDTVQKKHPDITRFKSPITFKPIWPNPNNPNQFDIYISLKANPTADSIPAELFNQTFNVTKNNKEANGLPMDTPTQHEFNLVHYFHFLYTDYRQLVLDNDPNVIVGSHADLNKLKAVFKTFRPFSSRA